MRDALGCVLHLRLGALPACPEDQALAADVSDRDERRNARRKGFLLFYHVSASRMFCIGFAHRCTVWRRSFPPCTGGLVRSAI